MPIFEYRCQSCGHQFEEIVLASGAEAPACPACQSKRVKRLISTPSIRPNGIPSGSGGFKPPACAPSG